MQEQNAPRFQEDVTATKRSPGRPKKEETPKDTGTADMIVRHAKRLFMQSGYAAVSISAIVEAVGITKPTLYYYFADKEALYAAVLADTLRRGGEYVSQGIGQMAGHNVRDILMLLATSYFRNTPASLTTLLRDASEQLNEAHLGTVLDAYKEHIMAPFATMLETAMARGEIRQQDPTALAYLIVGLLDTLVVSHTLRFSRKFAYEQLAETTISNLMDGMRPRS